MKTTTKNLFLLPVLMAGLGLMQPGRVTAQTITTLHNFAVSGSDGAFPHAGLVFSTNPSNIYTNSDGANPLGGVTLSGNTLYGTASGDGSSGNCTVFAVNADGPQGRRIKQYELQDFYLRAPGTDVYSKAQICVRKPRWNPFFKTTTTNKSRLNA